jgi:hypothetical protein
MLHQSTQYNGSPPPTSPAIPQPTRPRRGRYSASAQRAAVQRAFVAADLVLGKAPSIKQAAQLCVVSDRYVSAATRIAYQQPHLRSSVESGLEPLLAKRKQRSITERLIRLMAKATEAQRVEFVRAYGVDRVVNLAIAAERAA